MVRSPGFVEGKILGQDYKMQTIVYLKEPSLGGEATECSLCKHCGCMLNTDYIWLHLITSDYVSQVAQWKLTRTRIRNRKLTLCALNQC